MDDQEYLMIQFIAVITLSIIVFIIIIFIYSISRISNNPMYRISIVLYLQRNYIVIQHSSHLYIIANTRSNDQYVYKQKRYMTNHT